MALLLIGRLGTSRFIALMDQAVVSTTNMCTTIVIGRMCPHEELGLYASGFSLLQLAIAVQTALICIPYTLARPQMVGKAQLSYKGNTLLQQLCLCGTWTIIFLLASLWTFGETSRRDFSIILLTVALSCSATCFREFVRRVSCAELGFVLALFTDTLASLLQMVAVVFLAFTGRLNACTTLVAMGIASAVAGVAWIVVSSKTIRISRVTALADLKRNWLMGKWLMASSLLSSFSLEQYPWMIAAAAGDGEAAIWAAGNSVMSFLNPVVLALNNDAAPRVSHSFVSGGLRELNATVLRSASIAALLAAPIALILFFFGSDLVTLMYGTKYAKAGLVVALLTAGFFLYACGLSFPYGLLALRQQKIDFLINVLCALTFGVFGVAAVRGHGAVGAAYSYVTIQIVAFASRLIGFRISLRKAGQHPDLIAFQSFT